MSEGAQLATILRERASELLASWIVRFERSPLRFRRAAKAASYTAQVASLLESLTSAAHGGVDGLRPGQDATRELERSAAFLGARFAAEGATGFDIAALLLELRDVVAQVTDPTAAAPLTRLFEWLTVVALDTFAASGLQSLREQTADQLEAGTPIAELLPKVPAVFLVGAPTTSVLDNLLGRAWMLAVQCGAPCLVIDCGGLAASGERSLERAYGGFLQQVEGSALQICLASARRPLRDLVEKLTGERGVSFQHFDRLDSAIAHSLERAGHLLMKRS
jgi:hypothetical protein